MANLAVSGRFRQQRIKLPQLSLRCLELNFGFSLLYHKILTTLMLTLPQICFCIISDLSFQYMVVLFQRPLTSFREIQALLQGAIVGTLNLVISDLRIISQGCRPLFNFSFYRPFCSHGYRYPFNNLHSLPPMFLMRQFWMIENICRHVTKPRRHYR